MWNNIWTNLFFLVCLGIQIYFTVKAIWKWHKEDPLAWYKIQLDKFTTKMQEEFIPEMVTRDLKIYIDRLNLLSKENNKLIEENLKLLDKLKNLGFTEESLK